jgi:DNA repair protein RecO (recombination protein O)
MLYKTRGIVFRFTKYGDTSIIVTIFTEVFGLQTYIVNGIRSKSPKNKIALYQPLTLLDLVVYHKENVNILRIKEVQCAYQYHALGKDIRKSAIALFLCEVINRAVKEQSHAEEICLFLFDSFEALDDLENDEDFHLVFLIRLSRLLGFGPQFATEILGGWLMEPEEERILQELLRADYGTPLGLTRVQRRNIIEVILRFYNLHIENFGEMKSMAVLKEILG